MEILIIVLTVLYYLGWFAAVALVTIAILSRQKHYWYEITGHLQSDPQRVNHIELTNNGIMSCPFWLSPQKAFQWLKENQCKSDFKYQYQIASFQRIK